MLTVSLLSLSIQAIGAGASPRVKQENIYCQYRPVRESIPFLTLNTAPAGFSHHNPQDSRIPHRGRYYCGGMDGRLQYDGASWQSFFRTAKRSRTHYGHNISYGPQVEQ